MVSELSLRNFYESVTKSNPMLATLMHHDIMTVAMHAQAGDKPSWAQESADRLRSRAKTLPEEKQQALDIALKNLGYS